MRRASIVALFLILTTLAFGCAKKTDILFEKFGAEPRYLQNNIHAQYGVLGFVASYANWTEPGSNHVIFPVNTPVTFQSGKFGNIVINDMQHGREIFFEYNFENMRMSTEEYIEIISSPVQVVLDDLDEIDRTGIQDGKAYTGMTKKGVQIALGYPAAHLTPSLENNVWTYWKNRQRTMKVTFDDTGRVVTIQ